MNFLDLSAGHSEQDLQAAIIMNLKRFLLELGRDFAFVGKQYPAIVLSRQLSPRVDRCETPLIIVAGQFTIGVIFLSLRDRSRDPTFGDKVRG